MDAGRTRRGRGAPDEIEIATRRRDGTLRNPVTILGRPPRRRPPRAVGQRANSGWDRGAQTRHEARISAGGVQKDATLIDSDPEMHDQIDAEYRSKYRRYSGNTLRRITSREARSTTLKLVPRG